MDFLLSVWNKNAVRLIVVSVAVILGLKYVIPFLGPFLPAFLAVVLLHPFLEVLHRKTKLSKGILAGVLLALFTLLPLWLLSGVTVALADSFVNLLEVYKAYAEELGGILQSSLASLEVHLGIPDGVLSQGLERELAGLWQQVRLVFGREAVGISYRYLEKGVDVIFYLMFLTVGFILLVKDYENICEVLAGNKYTQCAVRIFKRLMGMLWVYLKAQGIVLFCISAVSIAGLWVLGIRNPWFFGLLAGILDVLPFIGAGMVLVPLGILSAIFGNFWALPGSIVLFVIVTFIRNLIEPKLMGAKLDVYPVLLLFSVFAGLAFYQIGGIVLGPVALFLIKEIYGEVKKK